VGPNQPDRVEIFAQLTKVLGAPEFRNSERLRQLLRFLVEQALETGTSHLKEVVIASEVFHRTDGYDPRDDATVRVAAGKLRARLREYYSREQSDPVVIEIPTGGYAPLFRYRDAIVQESAGNEVSVAAVAPNYSLGRYIRLRRSGVIWLSSLAIVLVCIACGLVFYRFPREDKESVLIRLTDDATFNGSPAISADGKFVAWVSERGLSGNRNIWVQHVSERQPVQLTSGEDSLAPSFSPDGSRVAFFRPGNGIYTVAASALGRSSDSAGREPARNTPLTAN
jgi:hypothetical protein